MEKKKKVLRQVKRGGVVGVGPAWRGRFDFCRTERRHPWIPLESSWTFSMPLVTAQQLRFALARWLDLPRDTADDQIRESILFAMGFFAAEDSASHGHTLTWFIEENQVKLIGPNGQLLLTCDAATFAESESVVRRRCLAAPETPLQSPFPAVRCNRHGPSRRIDRASGRTRLRLLYRRFIEFFVLANHACDRKHADNSVAGRRAQTLPKFGRLNQPTRLLEERPHVRDGVDASR